MQDTFKPLLLFRYYYGGNTPYIGGFTWHLIFYWRSLPEDADKQRVSFADPIPTPTFPGYVFAMERKWFYESGAYDDQWENTGGEDLEMSFRVISCHYFTLHFKIDLRRHLF